MKFTSVAMLAIAATPFLSMVSAQTLTQLLTAECTAPTPSPTKAKGASKGAKGARRQLQAKSGGKGSKSDDSDSSCGGAYLAARLVGTALTASVFEACDVVPPATVAATAVGTVTGGFTGNPADQTFTGTLIIPDEFPFPAAITFAGPANPTFSNAIADLIADPDCDLDFLTQINTPDGMVYIPPLPIVTETFPLSDVLLVPLGTITIAAPNPNAGTYLILYYYDCFGDFDPSDLSPPVFEYLSALVSGGCTDEEIVAGKKGF